MPVLLLLAFASTVGLLAGLVAWRYPRIASPAAPALDAARKVGVAVGKRPGLRAFLDARRDPATATGLALTVAMAVAIGGGVLFGVLAYLVRTNSHLIGLDNGVAKWGNRHATALSMHILNGITQLGSIYTIVALCVVLAVAETIRERSRWVAPFIVAVMGGEEILTLTVKQLADRVRPTFNPAAATLGPSFPSGHSATAAAFYATAALLIGRWRGRRARAVLAGLAVGNRGRGRSEPRAARRALALGRDRRARARLGLVRHLRDRVRRPHPPLRRRRGDGRAGRGGNGSERGSARAARGRSIVARVGAWSRDRGTIV